MRRFVLPLAFVIVAFFFLTFRNTVVPPGINGDEVGIARNAVLMSKNLTDENSNFLPLFIFAKTSDWKQPVTVYSTALVFKIFGSSLFTLRMTSALFVIASIVLLYFISMKKYDYKFFILSTLILLTTPIILIQSHLALENIAPLPFILFWILMLISYEKNKKPIYLLLAGAALGVGLFSYLGMRIISPVLLILTVIYLYRLKGKIIYFILGALPFYVLLGIANFYYPGAVFGHYSAPAPTIYEFLLRYLSVFDFSFLFLKGDAIAYHSTGNTGMFLVASLPLFIAGIYKIIKDKKPFELLILSSFFLSPILFGFVLDIYRASRIVALVPLFVIITTIGFTSLGKKLKTAIIVLLVINFVLFAKDYWYDYPGRVVKSFPYTVENYTSEFVRK